MKDNKIYIFHAEGARFAGGVFSTLESAEAWIQTNELSGLLTAYPLDCGVYEWAIKSKYFTPINGSHRTSQFIGGFTSASQEHYHYENGKNA